MTTPFTVAIDPGKTVGFAGVYHDSDQMLCDIASGQLPFDDFGDYFWQLLRNLEDWHVPTFVVCERFVISSGTVRKSTDAHWALETIGCVRWQAHRYGRPFKLQAISDAERFAPDKRLREANMYLPGRPHANDAVRHLMLSLAEDQHILPPWANL